MSNTFIDYKVWVSSAMIQSYKIRSIIVPRARASKIATACVLAACTAFVPASANAQGGPKTSPAKPAAGAQQAKPPQKGVELPEGSDPKAIAIYADAANFQNNAAYDLAIKEWQKLLADFPKDPLLSKASHYLGVCYMQMEKPNYKGATEAFRNAVSDTKMDLRQESLVNLGWCLYSLGRDLQAEGKNGSNEFKEATKVFTDFIKEFGDSSFVDQALFYGGESAYAVGDRQEAIRWYKRLVDARGLKDSTLRSDAMYAIGVAQEELNDNEAAAKSYGDLLANYPEFRLADETRIRQADLLLKAGKGAEAAQIFAVLAARKEGNLIDYALFRQAYAVASTGDFGGGAKLYQELMTRFPKSEFVEPARVAAGQMFFRSGDYQSAKGVFEQVLPKKDAAAAEAAHWLTQIALRSNQAAEAAKIARESLTWAEKSDFAVMLKMDLADALYEQPGGLEEASKIYQEIAESQGNDSLAARATYNVAFAALQSGNPQEAQAWAAKFVKRYPDDPLLSDIKYVEAESALLQGQFPVAITGYDKLIAADPNNPASPAWKLRLATARYLSGDFQGAMDQLQSQLPAFATANQKAEAQYLTGACKLQLKDYDGAIDALTNSRTTSSNWSQADQALLILAQAKTAKGDVPAAEADLQKLLQDYPNSSQKYQAQYRLGQLAAQAKRYDDAIQRYETLIASDSAGALVDYAKYGKAWCSLQQEKYKEAIAALNPLVDAGRTDLLGSEILLARGIAKRQIGQVKESIVDLEKLLSLNPVGDRLGHALYELGLSYAQEKQAAKAIEVFNRVRKDVPDYSAMDKVLYELGWALKQSEQAAPSAGIFKELVDKYPESSLYSEAAYHFAQTEYDAGNYQSAVDWYAKSADKASEAALKEKAIYKLGWSQFQMGSYEIAQTSFKQQSADFPNGPLAIDAMFMQGECEFKLESYEKAWQHYVAAREALEALPDRNQVSVPVQTLIYLHGAQSARELKRWDTEEQWLKSIIQKYPDTDYLPQVLYELAFCYQNQNKPNEALKQYSEVANNYRTEVAARSRFMMGEVYFAQRDFPKAIPEFQRVMFGFGGDAAPDAIKNWQARSGFEAGRCSEVLIADLTGDRKAKAVKIAADFYQYVVDKHPTHELASDAKKRLEELAKLK